MALLNSILSPCEGAFGTGAAFPHRCWRAVDGDIGASRALITDQLGARVLVDVLIVPLRKNGLVICAGCGQNSS